MHRSASSPTPDMAEPLEPSKRSAKSQPAFAVSKAPRFVTTQNGKSVVVNDPDRPYDPKQFVVQRVRVREADKEPPSEGVLAAPISNLRR